MNKGFELGIAPVKCENKEGNDKLKELHYQLNEICYKWSRRYISKDVAFRLIAQFRSIGVDISNVEVTDRCKAKKNELLKATRELYLIARTYYEKYQPKDEDKIQAMQTAKWQLSKYLKEKDNLTKDSVIMLLKDNKEVFDTIIKPNEVDYQPFVKMQNELISMLTLQYQLV